MDLLFNPYDYEFHDDPYPLYARLRAEAPVYRNEELDFWALSRYSDVAAAFRDYEAFSSANGVMIEPSVWGPEAWKFTSFVAMDPPRHTRMRGLISRAFTPRRVAALEPRIREIGGRYLDAALERGNFDFMADLAARLPMDVISELTGVPEADRPEVRRLADQMLHREQGMRDVPAAAVEAGLALSEYYLRLLAERRRAPADDLISALADAGTVGAHLADDELIAVLFLLIGAGSETTTHLLGSAGTGRGVTRHRGPAASVATSPAGSRRRCASTAPPRSSRARQPGTCHCMASGSRPGHGSCCSPGRPAEMARHSPARIVTTSDVTPAGTSTSAAAGISALARPWGGSRPGSCLNNLCGE